MRRLSLELDDETLRALSMHGEPTVVLGQLAHAWAVGTLRPDRPRRDRTDASLRRERSTTDNAFPLRDFAAERSSTDRDLSGERTGADSMIVDQREANEQMVAATIRAQELTDEATAARGRAEQSERTLRAVAEFREMFIGVLGHDLRNPLASIVMAAGALAQRDHLDEQDRECIRRILRGSQRMSRMITQLLDLTRARLGGGIPIEPKPTDLREVCRNIVDEFDAVIDLRFDGELTGNWDQDRLGEVLSNLVGNAIEHAASGTPVALHARGDGNEVVIEVANQGPPIPEHVLPFVFEPFRRAQQRKRSRRGNLGLGLYIAQQIAVAHGGTIEARSEEGTTTFRVRLPRSLAAADAP